MPLLGIEDEGLGVLFSELRGRFYSGCVCVTDRREREDRYPALIPLEHDDRPPPPGWGDQEEDAPSRRHDDDDGWHFKF